MANFDTALPYTLKNEGGFSEYANDRGHATNYGITVGTLSTYLGRPATVDDVKNMSMDTVKSIYRPMYWNQVSGDNLTKQAVATSLFDIGVVVGPRQATKFAQRIAGVIDDGVLGPKSIAAINAVPDQTFVTQLAFAAARFFAALAIKDSTQQAFLDGWLVRAFRMLVNFTAISGDLSLAKV